MHRLLLLWWVHYGMVYILVTLFHFFIGSYSFKLHKMSIDWEIVQNPISLTGFTKNTKEPTISLRMPCLTLQWLILVWLFTLWHGQKSKSIWLIHCLSLIYYCTLHFSWLSNLKYSENLLVRRKNITFTSHWSQNENAKLNIIRKLYQFLSH